MPAMPDSPHVAKARTPLLHMIGTTVIAALLSGCQSALFAGMNLRTGTQDVIVERNVVFDPEHQLAMDVYRPAQGQRLPTVVFFYGGSWKSGHRQWYRWVGEQLAREGMVVAIPDYRQWPQVRMEGFMQDSARAVAFVHEHAGQWQGDSHKLFVMGHSAGGHIAALLATDAHWLQAVDMQPQQLAGFVGLAGPYDFLPLKDPDYVDMFGHTAAEQRRSQPVNFVEGDEPAMLLLQGTDDHIVAPKNATSLADALRAKGEAVEVVMYPDTGHVGLLLQLADRRSKVRDDAVRFIKR
jgi:acetyl esterase/lipase